MNILADKKPPQNPGVYQFKDAGGLIIYIGKAKNLSQRVRTYFSGRPNDLKTRQLVENIADVEYILTDTELEALILESVLIKKHKPKYNIRLRDDKSYQFIKIDYSLPIPQIYSVRKKDERYQNGAKYFGPYTSGLNVRNTLRLVKKIFPYCLGKAVGRRPCFNYQLHRCPGVCLGEISLAEYKEHLKQIETFLQGKTREVEKSLQKQMKTAAKKELFEKAAALRDQLQALQDLTESQKIISMRPYNQDFISLQRRDKAAAVNVFLVRDGKLIGRENAILENLEHNSDAAVLKAFMERYYLDATNLPKEIFVPLKPDDYQLIERLVEKRFEEVWGKKQKIVIKVPLRGTARKLLKLGKENAENFLSQQLAKFEKEEVLIEQSLEFLRTLLKLKNKPRRIEAFDISNIQGTLAVGSMVVFGDGKPQKDQYRKFKIRSKKTPDDYAMMAEVLERRLYNSWPEPDLWIIDGGLGQLNIALKVLEKTGQVIPVIALAKDRGRTKSKDGDESVERWQEKIIIPGRKSPVILSEGHPAKSLVQRLRDEAHRFAITYHRNLRSKALFNG